MSAYYNEIDPYAAAWLRNLIDAGHLPAGDIDTRSIVEVQPDDLKGYDECHFFAGIGGWPLALRIARRTSRPVWTGSCPCQPFSAIGERLGTADERHLWPEFFRLISEFNPPTVFGEQVASKLGREWLVGVLADLESVGYAVAAADMCAAGVGAPHIRQRLYWVGDAEYAGLERHRWHGDKRGSAETDRPDAKAGGAGAMPASLDAVRVLRGVDVRDSRGTRSRLRLPADRGLEPRSIWGQFDALACSDGWRRVQSGTFPMADGVPSRVGRLRAYGNAIVPQVAAEFIRASQC